MNQASKRSKVALWLSIGCAIHCVSWPILLVFLPILGTQLAFVHEIELVLIGLSAGLSVWVLYPGYFNYRKKVPALLALAGFLLLLIPHISFVAEIWAGLGAALMASAQLLHIYHTAN